MKVFSPLDNSLITEVEADKSLDEKISKASNAQKNWAKLSLAERADKLEELAKAVEDNADEIAQIMHKESGKIIAECEGEVKNFHTNIRSTIEKVSFELEEFKDMKREKIYHPAGVVGLITSFNFPLAVAGWTIAPAMLAGNAVVWKPSEKTPLTALKIKEIFPDDLLQIAVGEIEIGKALVEHPDIAMVSATGSVAMGESIKKTLANKPTNKLPPIIEAGGNNGVIISANNSDENLEFAVKAIISSFACSSGQRCTNTRRLFIASEVYDKVLDLLKKELEGFESDSPLIDKAALENFKKACANADELIGGDLLEGLYVKPALAIMNSHKEALFEECFAPILYILKYDNFADALEMVNAPENAGLVNGIYTQSKAEVDVFIAANGAGHSVVNSPTGTGTPAFGMGFGGNKLSGTGEILNGYDYVRPFVIGANRVAINTKVELH